ncbi:MAG: peptidase S58 family protein [Deltaproteobacteria bacterium]|nr:P1 family peptidase [Deltaproteobacteria bacterium]RLA89389.1 MAG: peptidase S58 family protein [Deltaproteobacteria bacterium]
MYNNITDINGVTVGHASDFKGYTGCTVVLFEQGAIGGVDIRGTATSTRQIDGLRVLHLIDTINGILLTGGSAFGLDAAGGVLRYLEEKGKGYDVKVTKVPIVPTAALFDLAFGDPYARPTMEMGYEAAENAVNGVIAEGSVGAGTGATIGKLYGMKHAMKGGIGSASVRGEKGLIVGAIVAVNAFGDVIDPRTGEIMAGARKSNKSTEFVNSSLQIRQGVIRERLGEMNTTLCVIATNAKLLKPDVTKVAQMGQVGLSRTISPLHSTFDGDIIFAFSLGKIDANVNTVGLLGEEAIKQAVINAIKKADGFGIIPSHKEIFSLNEEKLK